MNISVKDEATAIQNENENLIQESAAFPDSNMTKDKDGFSSKGNGSSKNNNSGGNNQN